MIRMPSDVIVSLSQSKNTRNTLRASGGGAGGTGAAATGGGAPNRTIRLATRLCASYPEVTLMPGAGMPPSTKFRPVRKCGVAVPR